MYYIGGSEFEFEFEQLRSNSPLKTPNSGGALEPDAGPQIPATRWTVVHTAPGSLLGSIPIRAAAAFGQNSIGSPTFTTALVVILV